MGLTSELRFSLKTVNDPHPQPDDSNTCPPILCSRKHARDKNLKYIFHDWEIHTTGNLNKSGKENPRCENLMSTRTDKGRFLRLLQACNRDRECITESKRKRGQVCNWGHKFARSRHVTLFFLFYCLFFPFPSAAPLFAISVGTVNQQNWKQFWQLGRQVYYFNGNPLSNTTSILAFVTCPDIKIKHIRRLKFT